MRQLELTMCHASRNLRKSLNRAEKIGSALEHIAFPLPELEMATSAGRSKGKASSTATLYEMAREMGPAWVLVVFNLEILVQAVAMAVQWRDALTREAAVASKKVVVEKIVEKPTISPEEHDRRICEILQMPYPPAHLAWAPIPDEPLWTPTEADLGYPSLFPNYTPEPEGDRPPATDPRSVPQPDFSDPAVVALHADPEYREYKVGSPLSFEEHEHLERELKRCRDDRKKEADDPTKPRPRPRPRQQREYEHPSEQYGFGLRHDDYSGRSDDW